MSSYYKWDLVITYAFFGLKERIRQVLSRNLSTSTIFCAYVNRNFDMRTESYYFDDDMTAKENEFSIKDLGRTSKENEEETIRLVYHYEPQVEYPEVVVIEESKMNMRKFWQRTMRLLTFDYCKRKQL